MKKNKKTPVFALILSALLVLSSCGKQYPAKTEEQIESFLSDNGVEMSGKPSEKSILIPEEFGEVYENYNELQKKQGFDLKKYRSKDATVYTYGVISVNGEHKENTEAHVIVCGEVIIGGDIASVALDGEMTEIVKQ